MNNQLMTSTPHILTEDAACYSIIFNLLGHNPSDIGINVNEQKKELTVLARKETRNYRNGAFWTFGVPMDGILGNVSTHFQGGVLEILIPKNRAALAA
jgi:hypothetical protein